MPYYDLFLAPVEDARRADYEAFLIPMHKMFIDLGAIETVDLWAEDVPDGELTSLPLAVKLQEGESVASGYVIWPSKEARDAGWAKMMSDDSLFEMPFDGKRMVFGGFTLLKRTTA